VPFTYATSFMFNSDAIGQISTIFLHFLSGAILPLAVIALILIPQTVHTGNILRAAFTILPTFDVCYSIFLSSQAGLISTLRDQSIKNCPPDEQPSEDPNKYYCPLYPYPSDIWAP
jgi:hypothetical protein